MRSRETLSGGRKVRRRDWGGGGGGGRAGGARWPQRSKKGGVFGGTPGGGPKMGSFCPRVVHELCGDHCVPWHRVAKDARICIN